MKYAVGLMSGTSLDGVDAALVDEKFNLIDFITYDINKELLEKLKLALDINKSNNELLCSLNFELGYLFSEAVKAVCEKAKFDISKLDFIASHGQTIFHIPRSKGNFIASTLQLGEPAVIAYETGVKVISNFRTMDMAAGGEGAPLVPYADYYLFRSSKKSRVLLNIGGISNITILDKNGDLSSVYAFDTGPGNMIIDELMMSFYNKKYDEDGSIGLSGNIIDELLEEMLSNSFISKIPPKSTGREEFGKDYTQNIINKYKAYKREDIITTATYFTAMSIAYNIKNFISISIDEVIVSGGGVYNKLIMKLLNDLLDIKVMSIEELGYSPDAKEAIAFSVLGYRTLNREFSNVKSATGAKEDVILGNITYPPY